jgi:hypothetical protein
MMPLNADTSALATQFDSMVGYGIALGGATSSTVQGNNLTMTPWTSAYCGWSYYFREGGHADGSFQAGYEERGEMHWPCILSSSSTDF